VAAITQNCEVFGVQGHVAAECQVLTGVSPNQVNYTQGNLYSNNYNQGSMNHPYLSYKSNNALHTPGQSPSSGPLGFQKPAYPAQNAPRKSNLEIMMENFIASQAQTNIQTSEPIKQLTSKIDVLATHNRMLETQISQVAQQQADNT
jgi:hypothetical protein